MDEKEIWDNVYEMNSKIFGYVKACELNSEKREKLFLHMAASYLCATINVADSDTLSQILNNCTTIGVLSCDAISRIKNGDKTNIVDSIFEKGE